MTRLRNKTLSVLVVLVILFSVFAFGSFSSAVVGYTYYEGNDSGQQLDPALATLINGLTKVKFDGTGDYNKVLDGISVVVENNLLHFTWQSLNHPIKYVYVKASNRGFLFDYNGATSGS